MIPIVVVTHGGLGRELVHTVQIIVGTQPAFFSVCLEEHEGIEDLKRKLLAVLPAPEAVPEGALVLVDMFGGTPSNVTLALSQSYPLRVLTGVNLPMLLEALTHRASGDLAGLAGLVAEKGRRSVFDANELLNPKGNRGEGSHGR
jgi:PTS system mannose-specific IIA component